VNPDDAQSMAEAIVRTCTDEQLRQDMIKAGKTYALNFTEQMQEKIMLAGELTTFILVKI
jgi:glycosyltransferase involved in cell wall biosynthesis